MSPIYSHRSTTSSRRPGAALQGTVRFHALPLIRCPRCHGTTTVDSEWHGHHWSRLKCGHLGHVNCIGEQLVACEWCPE